MILRRLGVLALVALCSRGASAQTPAPSAVPACARGAVLITIDGGTGSGTMIDPRGYVLTNHHVVAPVLVPGFDGPSLRGGAHLRVQIPDVRSLEATEAYDAEILADDPTLDLAILRVLGRAGEAPRPDARFEAIPLADGDALATGTAVTVLGYPFGHRILTVLSGTVSGRREQTDGAVDWLTIDAPFNPGNSGGTVIDASCRVVGVPTQVFRGGLNPVNMARPIDDRVRAFVRAPLEPRVAARAASSTPPGFGDDLPAPTAKPPASPTPRRRGRR